MYMSTWYKGFTKNSKNKVRGNRFWNHPTGRIARSRSGWVVEYSQILGPRYNTCSYIYVYQAGKKVLAKTQKEHSR